jgi:hypothetical protein
MDAPAGDSMMSRATIEERVAELEKQVGALLAHHAAPKRFKDWRRTRGIFTGDDFMKKVFQEGSKIRAADRKQPEARTRKRRPADS